MPMTVSSEVMSAESDAEMYRVPWLIMVCANGTTTKPKMHKGRSAVREISTSILLAMKDMLAPKKPPIIQTAIRLMFRFLRRCARLTPRGSRVISGIASTSQFDLAYMILSC